MSASASAPEASHTYAFDELKPGTGSNQQPYFKFLLFFTKKQGTTDEYMHEHWKTAHADLTLASVDAGVEIVRYTQVWG